MRKCLLVLASALILLGIAWGWYPGSCSYFHYLRILPGMSQARVHCILGPGGREIDKEFVTRVVDWDEPQDSPGRLKPVIDGERFFRWERGTCYIIVSFKGDMVVDKFYWAPSL